MNTVIITKQSVKETQAGLFTITLNFRYSDGVQDLVNQDFSVRYRTGQIPSVALAKVKAEMQGIIDAYKREQTILNAPTLNTAITNLQGSLQV